MSGPPYDFGIPNTVLPGNYYFSQTRMDSAINDIGINILWRQSHSCPCGALTGSPDPQCTQCGGFGRYWDAPTTAFTGIISIMYPEDPSGNTDRQLGTFIEAQPVLTIPQSTAATVWASAALYDMFVLPDMTQRFSIGLQNGAGQNSKTNALPYSYGVTVPVSGAVQVYNTQTHVVSADNNYTISTVNGITYINLTDWPFEQPFTVDYTANQSYVAYDRGGMPHIRPVVGGMLMPRRFHINPLDIWLRGHSTTGNP